jgi:hypothetical protein
MASHGESAESTWNTSVLLAITIDTCFRSIYLGVNPADSPIMIDSGALMAISPCAKYFVEELQPLETDHDTGNFQHCQY